MADYEGYGDDIPQGENPGVHLTGPIIDFFNSKFRSWGGPGTNRGIEVEGIDLPISDTHIRKGKTPGSAEVRSRGHTGELIKLAVPLGAVMLATATMYARRKSSSD